MATLLQTLEARVKTHGEAVLSPEDLSELYRLRADGASVDEQEEFIEEHEEDKLDDED